MDLFPAPTAGMIVSIFETWRGKVFYVNVSPDAREPTLMCRSTVLTQSFILTQCRKLTGLRSCVLRVSIHSVLAKKGSERYLLPQPSLRCETLPPASGRYSKYLGMCWPEACRHLKAYKFVFSNSPSATSILGDSVIGHLVQCLLEGTS